MQVRKSGTNRDNPSGSCYTKKADDNLLFKLSLYEDNSLYFSKSGELEEDGVITTFDLSCTGTFQIKSKSLILETEGLRGEISSLSMKNGEIEDKFVAEDARSISISEEEIATFWLWGGWGNSASNESDSD